MRSALVILICGLLLGGCKTADDFIGSGPITIAPNIQKFVNEYITNPESTIAVREDGNYAYVSYCPMNVGCLGGHFTEVIDGCESYGGKCWIYGLEGYVVWKGPVTVAEARSEGGEHYLLPHFRTPSDCEVLFNERDWAWCKEIVAKRIRREAGQSAPPKKAQVSKTKPQGSPKIEERLAKLKKLLNRGLLTEEEAAEKRKEILNSL